MISLFLIQLASQPGKGLPSYYLLLPRALSRPGVERPLSKHMLWENTLIFIWFIRYGSTWLSSRHQEGRGRRIKSWGYTLATQRQFISTDYQTKKPNKQTYKRDGQGWRPEFGSSTHNKLRAWPHCWRWRQRIDGLPPGSTRKSFKGFKRWM